MTEIPYMMTNTRAEFERVRDLAWPVTDRTAATDAEFRSRIQAFDGADEAEESLRERLIDALDAELDSLGLSQGISSRAAYHLAQTALDVVTTPVIPAAVAAYRAAQDSGAEEAVRECGSRGPRIGSEGQPICRQSERHAGPHRPAADDGWGDVTWNDFS